MAVFRRLLIGIVAVVFLLVGGLGLTAYLLDLEGLVQKHKPEALAAASKALDREVDLGGISATWFPTLSVRLENIRIGDDPLSASATVAKSGKDFFSARALEVGVAVWPALVSFGRDIELSTIQILDPAVRVVRKPDGSFNFSTIGGAKTDEPPPPPAEGPSIADRFTSALVQEILLSGGSVRYEDQMSGAEPVQVDAIRLAAQDVGLGAPVRAELSLALGGVEEPNIKARLETGPLADKVSELGAPLLEQVVLQLLDLPLSAIPVKVEAVEGDVILGADLRVAPKANGYVLAGPISAEGIRLPGPRRAEAFAVGMELAVQTSTSFDDVRLDGTTLKVQSFQAGLSGRVRTAPELRWDDIELSTSQPFTLARLLAILPSELPPVPAGALSLKVSSEGNLSSAKSGLRLDWSGFQYSTGGVEAKGSLALLAKASGALASPTLSADLDASSLAVKGDGYAKPAGTRTGAQLAVSMGKSAVKLKKLDIQLAEAKLHAEGQYPLGTSGKGQIDFGLLPVALEPLMKTLGLPTDSLPAGSELKMSGRYLVDAADPSGAQVQIPELSYRAGPSNFTASASVERLDPLRARLDGRSSFLDLDALMPPAPEGGSKPSSGGAGKAPAPSGEPMLPPSMKSARVVTTLAVKKLKSQGIEMNGVDVRLVLEGGVLKVERTQVGLFGGRFSADGSTVDLGVAPMKYDLSARLQKMDGGKLLGFLGGLDDALTGTLDSSMQFSGRGLSLDDLGSSLDGAFEMALSNGHFDGVDLVGQTIAPLADALKLAASKGVGKTERLQTDFKRLAGRFELHEGQLKTKAPITVNTSQGDFAFEGGLGVDGKLKLDGSYAVPAGLIRKMSGNKLKPSSDIPVGLSLGCTLAKPCVEGVKVDGAAEQLGKAAAGKLIDEAASRLGGKAGKAAEAAKAVLEDPGAAAKKAEEAARAAAEKAKAEAEARAKAAADKAKAEAEARAKAEAEKAKKKAEQEAKKRLKGLFGR